MSYPFNCPFLCFSQCNVDQWSQQRKRKSLLLCLSQCGSAERAKAPRAKLRSQKPSEDLITHLKEKHWSLITYFPFRWFWYISRSFNRAANPPLSPQPNSPITLLKFKLYGQTDHFFSLIHRNCPTPSLFIEENCSENIARSSTARAYNKPEFFVNARLPNLENSTLFC